MFALNWIHVAILWISRSEQWKNLRVIAQSIDSHLLFKNVFNWSSDKWVEILKAGFLSLDVIKRNIIDVDVSSTQWCYIFLLPFSPILTRKNTILYWVNFIYSSILKSWKLTEVFLETIFWVNSLIGIPCILQMQAFVC